MSKRKYYLYATQGQGGIPQGPYRAEEIRYNFLNLVGDMSVGIATKNDKGEYLLITKEEQQKIFPVPEDLLQEYISAKMLVNRLYGQMRRSLNI